jgi:hypothetical protein
MQRGKKEISYWQMTWLYMYRKLTTPLKIVPNWLINSVIFWDTNQHTKVSNILMPITILSRKK